MGDNNNTERDERGQFTPAHTDDEFLQAVEALEMPGTKAVADEVGVTRQNADQRLRRLADEGRVRSKMTGNSLVWMLTDGSEQRPDVDPAAARKHLRRALDELPSDVPGRAAVEDALAELGREDS